MRNNEFRLKKRSWQKRLTDSHFRGNDGSMVALILGADPESH
jgi:hypothetical protein